VVSAPPAAMTPVPVVPTSRPPAEGGVQPMGFESYNAGDTFMGTCPDCGSQLEFAEGCVKCHVCGFSECG
jgi:ribonucleoside-diphosphate reductase alpha chain